MRSLALAGVALAATLAGCAPTPAQQAAAFAPSSATVAGRAVQARRFDTRDQTLMLQAALGALQDLGFTVEETQPQFGVIVATKRAGAVIRAQVVLHPTQDGGASIVRVTLQRVLPGVGARPGSGELLTDPALYRGFFDKLAQSAFLTAYDI